MSTPRTPRTLDVAALIDGSRLGRFNYRVVVLSWLVTAFDGMDNLMSGFVAPYLHEEMHLSLPQLGWLAFAASGGMVLGGFVFSYLADRLGRRPAIILCTVAFGILTAATAAASTFEALLVMRFLDGVPLGGLIPLAWAINIEFSPRRMRSSMVTVIMLGYAMGGLVVGPLTNWLAPAHGWQMVYLVAGITTLGCAAVLWLGLPESVRFLVAKGRDPAQVARRLRQIDPGCDAVPTDTFLLGDEVTAAREFHVRELFRGALRWVTPMLWLSYFMSTIAIFVLTSWSPIIIESLDFARSTAALVASLSSAFGALAALVLMRFTDRHGPAAITACSGAAIPVLLLIGVGWVPHELFLAASIVGSVLLSGMHYGMHSIAGIYYPSAIRASGGGWASSVAKLGAVLGPLIAAFILASDLAKVRIFALLALCPLVVTLSVLAIAAVVRAGGKAAGGREWVSNPPGTG
ncbi:MAG: MFS transporter [Gammaproteobacteria bacterium]|nr:MFS transporter [Gammaproteobacteria bacterium]